MRLMSILCWTTFLVQFCAVLLMYLVFGPWLPLNVLLSQPLIVILKTTTYRNLGSDSTCRCQNN